MTDSVFHCVCVCVYIEIRECKKQNKEPPSKIHTWNISHSGKYDVTVLRKMTFDTLVDKRLATGWTVRESNAGGREIFRTRPDRSWDPLSLLHNKHRVSFPGLKWPGRDKHPASSSAEVKERVELYLYSPSGTSGFVLGRTLSLL
jgi:hypothetical protein